MCVYRERWLFFHELARAIVESGKSQICRVGQQARDLGRKFAARIFISSGGTIFVVVACFFVFFFFIKNLG